MPERSVSEEALGRLLLLQSALHAAPDEERLCQMVAGGFAGLPGVTGSAVCLGGTLHGSTLPPGLPPCAAARPEGGECAARCEEAAAVQGLAVHRIATPRRCYGGLVLAAPPEVLARYRAAARNVANLAALRFETERQQAALAALNQALEVRVEERTALLAAEKARLAAALEALRQSEARYRLLADHAQDVIWTLDLATGRFGYVSPSITSLRGLTVEEAVAEPVSESLTPESLARVMAVMARIGTPAEEDPHIGVYDQPCRDGSVKHVEITTRLVRDAAGRPVQLVGVSRDATSRVEAERARQAGEARFRALIERATDMLVVLDASMRITFWSPSATEQLGWSAEEACASRGADLVHPDDRQHSRETFQALLRTPGGSARFVRRQLHRDGTARLVEVNARNLLDDPAVRGVVAHLRDLTDQRRLEEQFHQAQKLESLGRLAGGVAHDFNNLLTVILSCSGALRRDLAEGQPAQADDVDEIQAAAERARDLTRQLLAFARRQVVAPLPLDLNEVVRRAEKLLRRVLGEDVALRVELAPDPWPVMADPGQLEQVLLNLAVNARDAMPRGGTLTITTGRATEAGGPGEPARDWVCLAVRDTGVGLSHEAQAHLFEPFFTTKGPGKGTGLGLATVYGIVAQAGGRLRVRSAPGQGAEFEVRLPRGRQGAAPVEAPAPAPPRGGTETVLVVEDDPAVRAVTARALRAGGYRVLAAAHGEEALELAAREPGPIHLVVTDVVMPGLDGRAVVEALQARRPGLPALFVSGYSHDIISHHGALDSGLAFLPKPFTDELLLERVRAVLDGAAARP